MNTIPEFASFTLKEKLQSQIESMLDLYLSDREFLVNAYKLILDSPLRTFSELAPARDYFTENVRQFLKEAVDNGEIPKQSLESFVINLYWDFYTLIIFYWLRDDSENFSNTTRIIDQSLDIFVDILKSNLISKTADILSFLLRSHLFNNLEKFFEVFSLFQKASKGLGNYMKDQEKDGEKT